MRSVRLIAWLALVALTALGIAETRGEEGEKNQRVPKNYLNSETRMGMGFSHLKNSRVLLKKKR